jgi:hypothetical protein
MQRQLLPTIITELERITIPDWLASLEAFSALDGPRRLCGAYTQGELTAGTKGIEYKERGKQL